MRRRDVIAFAASAAAWPLAARAQAKAPPVIVVVSGRSERTGTALLTAFSAGLSEQGLTDGRDLTVEIHWLDGRYELLPDLLARLNQRDVALVAIPGSVPVVLAAKSALRTIPIIFGVGQNPTRLGLVASLSHPGGNATGVNYFIEEVTAKRLQLLHELLPKAARIAVLVNTANTSNTQTTLRDLEPEASRLGMQLAPAGAETREGIAAVFDSFATAPPDALFVAPDAALANFGRYIPDLAAQHRLPAIYGSREYVADGGLISYGADLTWMFRQVGTYAGLVLKGAKPADLPVIQSTRFALSLNLTAAHALGLDIPTTILAQADEVIE